MLGMAEAGRFHRDPEHPTSRFGPYEFESPTTEKIALGATEQWNLFNFTADSHPIHLHLTQYQVVQKRHIEFRDRNEDGVPDDTNHDGKITYGSGSVPNYKKADIWIGKAVKLRPEETGWQDTVHVDPNQMMSVVAKFDKPGEYVWHCHILSHEDNEMMRPFTVVPNPASEWHG
jgi:spore coat protein A